MDKEYLKKLEADRSEILKGSTETFNILEEKAKYVATAFVALLASICGYSLSSFANSSLWQQSFLVGLLPCFAICFLKLIGALRARTYTTGVTYPFQDSANIESYLVWRSDDLLDAINNNRASNGLKASYVNAAFVALATSAPVAIICGLIGASFFIYSDDLGLRLNDFWFLLFILLLSSVVSVVSVRHLSSLLNGDSRNNVSRNDG